MNRLIHEQSPYLRQHAENPVDWYPWGEAAFAAAAEGDRPLFISIGYATCHWCHVMAHDSFENDRIATLLNAGFIPVKIDREELPHLDDYYMTAFQILNGPGGGWPLTIFAAPDGRPFIAATFIPRESSGGRPGLLQLLPRVEDLWKSERDRVESTADAVAAALKEEARPVTAPLLRTAAEEEDLESPLTTAEEILADRYDERNGGFGGAPKFPACHTLLFLLGRYRSSGRERDLRMAEETFAAIRAGGIYDQIGYGVHRYSTDAEWRLPHFEKMLYDQANLTAAAGELFRITGSPIYREVIEEVAAYLDRNLRSPDGAFFSAEDADSEGEEGRFYLWSTDELRQCLSVEEMTDLERSFYIREAGNFVPEDGSSGGANILYRQRSNDGGFAPPPGEPLRRKLLQIREKRERPFLDDKILADWNGYIIGALARAGALLDQPEAIESAMRAWRFVIEKMSRREGETLLLGHRWRGGELQPRAFLDDYAFMISGSLELFLATGSARCLETALALALRADNEFGLPGGGYALAGPGDGEIGNGRLFLHDGAYPCGNSVMLRNLHRLFRLTGSSDWDSAFRTLLNRLYAAAAEHPMALLDTLTTIAEYGARGREIVVAGSPESAATRRWLARLRSITGPEDLVIPRIPDDETLPALLPFTARMLPDGDRPRIYICRDRVCALPVTEWEAARKLLGRE